MLHGICYAFFFATVYIFVDEFFPKDARASAQGLFNLMILGFGPLVANVIGPKLMGETFKTATGVDFQEPVPGAVRHRRRRRRRAAALLPPAARRSSRSSPARPAPAH